MRKFLAALALAACLAACGPQGQGKQVEQAPDAVCKGVTCPGDCRPDPSDCLCRNCPGVTNPPPAPPRKSN
jgi:hypothetical protein